MKQRILVILLNFTLIIFVVFNKIEIEQNIASILFALSFFFIGIVVYLIAPKEAIVHSFFKLMCLTQWIFLLLLSSSQLMLVGGQILMSWVPMIVFSFFIELNGMEKTSLGSGLSSILATLGAAMTFSILGLPLYFYKIFIGGFMLSLLFCGIMSYQHRFTQRTFFRRYQGLLLTSLMVSLVPYGALLFPAVVVYILIKREVLYLNINYYLLDKRVSFYFAFLVYSMFIGFQMFEWTWVEYSWLVSGVLLFNFCRDHLNVHLNKEQVELIHQSKETLNQEKLEIFQKISYDDYLSSLSEMLRSLMQKTIPSTGTMIVWRERERMYLFEQSGVFENYQLRRGQIFEEETFDSVMVGEKEYLYFPLRYQAVTYGWMFIGDKWSGGTFDLYDLEQANELALTICELLRMSDILHENQRRYMKLPNLTYDDYLNLQLAHSIEQFRKQVALYLHDDVLQNVLALRKMVELLQPNDQELQQLVLETFSQLDESLRDKMFDIYPTALDDLGLSQSLSILCNKMKRLAVNQPNLSIRLRVDEALDVEKRLRYPIFRTVKELLQNAIKHGEASQVVINIQGEGRFLLIHVSDDGVGFDIRQDLETKTSHHIGLLSIKQEINALHGEFSVTSAKGKGTQIKIKLPKENVDEGYVVR